MAVTTTAQRSLIRDLLIKAHPQFTFVKTASSRWSYDTKTIHYCSDDTDEALAELFHEVGHGLSEHSSYNQDIELIGMERQAWDVAVTLARSYDFTIDSDIVETSIDSYREWLHARSRCPHCAQAGIQQHDSNQYYCTLCGTHWSVNQAKQCGLKRYIQK